MDTYTVDAGGDWRLYHPKPVPNGWRMLGTIWCDGDHSTGALARSPDGRYAQINRHSVRMLDKQAVAAALTRVVLPVTYRRGRESLRR